LIRHWSLFPPWLQQEAETTRPHRLNLGMTPDCPGEPVLGPSFAGCAGAARR